MKMFISKDLEFLFELGSDKQENKDKVWDEPFHPQTQNGQCVGDHHVCGAVRWFRNQNFGNSSPISSNKFLTSDLNTHPHTEIESNDSDSESSFDCDLHCIRKLSPTDETFWQDRMCNVKERISALFNTDVMSDVKFIFTQRDSTEDSAGNEFEMQPKTLKNFQKKPFVYVIPAHKHVLAMGSSVFFAMFYGPMKEQKNSIEIIDIHPKAFLHMLRYLYCDDLNVHENCIWSTVYAAQKYQLVMLLNACEQKLMNSLKVENVCQVLIQNQFFELQRLNHRCMELIDAQTQQVTQTQGFLDLNQNLLRQIISRNTLNANESQLYQACLLWANAQFIRQNGQNGHESKPQPEQLRRLLGSVLFALRLPCMGLEAFAQGPATSGLLSGDECTQLFLHYTTQNPLNMQPLSSLSYSSLHSQYSKVNKNALKFHEYSSAVDSLKNISSFDFIQKFPQEPRCGLSVLRAHRFQSIGSRPYQWNYRGRPDCIQFSVDRRVFILGYGLFGSSTHHKCSYRVRMWLSDCHDGRKLAERLTSFECKKLREQKSVMFEHPIEIKPMHSYTAGVLIDGGQVSYFGLDGHTKVSCSDPLMPSNVFNFRFCCSTESTNGTGVQAGQIPEIIFCASNDQMSI